jgi:hypothetical protein
MGDFLAIGSSDKVLRSSLGEWGQRLEVGPHNSPCDEVEE